MVRCVELNLVLRASQKDNRNMRSPATRFAIVLIHVPGITSVVALKFTSNAGAAQLSFRELPALKTRSPVVRWTRLVNIIMRRAMIVPQMGRVLNTHARTICMRADFLTPLGTVLGFELVFYLIFMDRTDLVSVLIAVLDAFIVSSFRRAVYVAMSWTQWKIAERFVK